MEPYSKEAKEGGTITPLTRHPRLAFMNNSNSNSSKNKRRKTEYDERGASQSPESQLEFTQIHPPPILPTFIYANDSKLMRSSVVFLVQVQKCFVYKNGTADVTIQPISCGRVEHLWKRREREPNFNSHYNQMMDQFGFHNIGGGTGKPDLYEARVIKLGEKETNEYLAKRISERF